ncbi:hypothetical protein MASR1M46_19990 [Bacteroidales bacterium]
MSANNKRDEFTREDLLAVARNMGIKNALSIVNQIADVISSWNRYASEAAVKKEHMYQIGKNLLVIK